MVEHLPYHDPEWLKDTIADVIRFYYPECIDNEVGGYIAQFDEKTGEIYDQNTKHLVATCRFIVSFSVVSRLDGLEDYEPAVEHGMEFLMTAHHDQERGGFHQLMDGSSPVDSRRVCYGHAFALLATARAEAVNGIDTDSALETTYGVIIDKFWEEEHSLCKSSYDSDWTDPEAYRGQNASMHMCEATIAVYEATGRQRYLDRATDIAQSIVVDLADETDGLIWEHYTSDWEHDFEYNTDKPEHQFRPWGYQPGHHLEWAKLLGILLRHTSADWLLPRAEELFTYAVTHGWDEETGGFYYTLDRDGDPVVTKKYTWAVAEAIGAAAVLFEQTNDSRYSEWYSTLWEYADNHLIHPQHRSWYVKVGEDNTPIPATSGVSVSGGYHPIGACLEGVQSFDT